MSSFAEILQRIDSRLDLPQPARSRILLEIAADLVVLATAIEPEPSAIDLAKILRLQTDADGFFAEAHPKLRPIESVTSGFFLAGCGHGPKDIPETVIQASGAAAQAIAQVLGVEPEPKQIEQALRQATPEQLAEIKFEVQAPGG